MWQERLSLDLPADEWQASAYEKAMDRAEQLPLLQMVMVAQKSYILAAWSSLVQSSRQLIAAVVLAMRNCLVTSGAKTFQGATSDGIASQAATTIRLSQ